MQLRKQYAAPAYHEFILVSTRAGHTYRVDRGRDGPVFETMNKLGVPPCDTIELVQSTSLEEIDRTSACMIELHWGDDSDKTIDLLLALNICFQVHNESGRRYKLLTRNCYFLAQTIIMIVVRKTVACRARLDQVLKRGICDRTWKLCWEAVGKDNLLGYYSVHSLGPSLGSLLEEVLEGVMGGVLGEELSQALGQVLGEKLGQGLGERMDWGEERNEIRRLDLGWDMGWWEEGNGFWRWAHRDSGRRVRVVRWALRKWALRWAVWQRLRKWERQVQEKEREWEHQQWEQQQQEWERRPQQEERPRQQWQREQQQEGGWWWREPLLERRHRWEQEWEQGWAQNQTQNQALVLARRALADVLELALSGEPDWHLKKVGEPDAQTNAVPKTLSHLWWLMESLGKIVIRKVNEAPFLDSSLSELLEFPASFSVSSKFNSETPYVLIRRYKDLEEYMKRIIERHIDSVPPAFGSREDLKADILGGMKWTWCLVSPHSPESA